LFLIGLLDLEQGARFRERTGYRHAGADTVNRSWLPLPVAWVSFYSLESVTSEVQIECMPVSCSVKAASQADYFMVRCSV